jgi:hypothetical protein
MGSDPRPASPDLKKGHEVERKIAARPPGGNCPLILVRFTHCGPL